MIETNLQFLCLRLLREAFGEVGELLEGSVIDSVIRSALRDERCARLPEFQNILKRAGMVKTFSERLKRTASPLLQDEETLPWFADRSLETLRTVYREKLAGAGGIDAPGLFLKFMESSQSPDLQQSIEKWHESLLKKLGNEYNLVIPDAEGFLDVENRLEQNCISILMDRFERVDFGTAIWPDDTADRFQKVTEYWTTLGLAPQVLPLPDDAPESHFLKRFIDEVKVADELQFVSAKSPADEIHSTVDHVLKLLEGGVDADSIAIQTPLQGDFLDQLRDDLTSAGVPLEPASVPLIEFPLVRTVLDIAQAILDDWPVSAVADLLRHPDFQADSITKAGSTDERLKLAQDAERLGNVNGLVNITKLFPARHEAIQKRRKDEIETNYTIYCSSLLRNLEEVVRKPAESLSWNDSVGHFKTIIETLLGPVVMDAPEVAEFWKTLEAASIWCEPDPSTIWSWGEFYRESHLLAEQKYLTANFNTWADENKEAKKVTLSSGSESAGPVEHLLLIGLIEGHFPSRSRIREKLKKMPLFELEALKGIEADEMRLFRRLVGSAGQTLYISRHERDQRGIETESAGFVRNETWQQAPPKPARPLELQLSDHVRHLLKVWQARSRHVSGPFTGDIGLPHVRETLAGHFNGNYIFSPTSLESAALCPFQFFSTYVLGLADEEEENDLETDFIAEGNAIHAILEELHQLEDQPQILLDDIPALLEKLADLIRLKHACPPELADSALGRARWEVEHRRIEQRLAAYHDQLQGDLEPPSKYARGNGKINAHSEFGGDITVIGREVRAGSSRYNLQPLRLREEQTGIDFQVGGRIDRIDGQASEGAARVRLLDYKTGSQISESHIRRRLHLQLPIYAMMVHEKLLNDRRMEVVDVGFWYLKRSKGGYRSIRLWLTDAENGKLDIQSLANEYRSHLQLLVGRIRNGFFPVRPQEYGCQRHCPYGEVCRINEQRQFRDHAPGDKAIQSSR